MSRALTGGATMQLAIIALTVAIAAWTAYLGFTGGGWLGGLLYGVLLPLAVLAEWHFVRKPSDEARRAADSMMFAFMLALLGLGSVVHRAQERERELEAQCVPQPGTATEAPSEVFQGKPP